MASGGLSGARYVRSVRLRRWLVFLLVFLPCMLVSQIYIFLQPAIYQSVATVLTMAATDIDQNSPAADIQHVSIQKQLLLSPAILDKTVEHLQNMLTNNREWNSDQLREMFAVTPEPDTNLVHLRAEGPEPKVLQRSVNAWIETYLRLRAAFIADNTDKVTGEINDQLRRIDRQVAEKRNQVERFRLQHNILSTESADNEAHARLQGLNSSLNSALDDEVKAKAKLDTVTAAISRNEVVVPEEDTRAMAVLLEQAEKLREQLAAIEAQYTKDYIDLNPNLRRVREQLVEIEAKIAEKAGVGKDFARQEAEHNYSAAREAVLQIKQQLQAHKQLAADYTSRFSEHQALQQELLKLETLQQDTKQRLADIEVKQREKYPQVDVVEWASLPDKPIRPDYLQESLLAFAGSLALALLTLLIIDYLNREPPPAAPMNLGGIHLHHQPRAMLDVSELPTPQVGHAPLKALPVDNSLRELERPEVLALNQVAEPSIKAVVYLLFNGLTLGEILSLTPECLNTEALMILIPGQRNVLMTESVADCFSGDFALQNLPNEAEIKTLLCCAALDSGLQDPESVTIESLRHTYMLYLVRQGIKLADLTKVVGALSPAQLLELGRFSPAQSGLPLESINLEYFI
ncbi:Wzz/FepE/Etk N-terminal domain-containing protein [Methylomonas sp. SURF-2]|uniref:Wzz/FepE/Etk N-terminal domain-containing protein n=1 Tax=Methylomonas subterranea TaxID=2952225 RepID=A0ABT1TGJ7_9GAMM|nr:Wzz/FepE/Etk N-terminal domain-containing protein [Methylomonas sp. SURF-2]MCQ8104588.1 Wzz/FepE/Etk N-terminal domain-containing protein [Methylomonas sp. SURF-2]